MKETPVAMRPTVAEIEKELGRRKNAGLWRKTLRRLTGALVVAAAITVLITMLWLPLMQVFGTSMAPVLQDGDIVLVAKDQRDIGYGDMIAFYFNNKILIKRVVGLPGDEIVIEEDGDVYVNGVYRDEPYIKMKDLGINEQEYPIVVPANAYFVLGDNRSVSIDSRSKDLGMVYGERVIGRMIFRFWPFDRFGKII